MSPRILCEFLIGSRRAIETVAATRAAWVPAVLFALSAGFAREYDGEDLLAAPWHFLRPLGVSFVTATVLFLVVHGSALAWSKAKKVPTPELRPAFLRFLTLFWWTAPLAWLYAVPYERFLAPLAAFEANLWTLGVVAAWRVLLIARVVGVVYGVHFARALCLVLVFADALVFFVGAVVPGPVIDLMGGINHGEKDQVLAQVKMDMWVLSMFAAPFVLVAWIWSVWTLRPSWPDLAAKAAASARGATRLAVASLLVWLPILPFTQVEQRLKTRTAALLRGGEVAAGLRLMSAHERGDYPPRWEPPPRLGFGDAPVVSEVRAALERMPEPPADWVMRAYRRKIERDFLIRHGSDSRGADLGKLLEFWRRRPPEPGDWRLQGKQDAVDALRFLVKHPGEGDESSRETPRELLELVEDWPAPESE